MRTLSAVRTRLRGTPDPDDAPDHDAEPAGNGDACVGGRRPRRGVRRAAGGSPMDPLLADPPVANGHGAPIAVADTRRRVAEPGSPTAEVRRRTRPRSSRHRPRWRRAPAPSRSTCLRRLPPPPERAAATRPPTRPRPQRQRVRPDACRCCAAARRVRKVTRIVRRVDAWGVFKISVVFYVILYIILLVAGVLLWNLANTTGTVANVEGFARDLFGLKTFEFDGEKLFRASWVLGAILVVAGTGLNVTLAVLFNLISDLMGGVRVTVLEEEVILRQRPGAAGAARAGRRIRRRTWRRRCRRQKRLTPAHHRRVASRRCETRGYSSVG